MIGGGGGGRVVATLLWLVEHAILFGAGIKSAFRRGLRLRLRHPTRRRPCLPVSIACAYARKSAIASGWRRPSHSNFFSFSRMAPGWVGIGDGPGEGPVGPGGPPSGCMGCPNSCQVADSCSGPRWSNSRPIGVIRRKRCPPKNASFVVEGDGQILPTHCKCRCIDDLLAHGPHR